MGGFRESGIANSEVEYRDGWGSRREDEDDDAESILDSDAEDRAL